MRAAIFIDGAYLIQLMKQNNIAPNYSNLTDYLVKPLLKSTQIDLLRCYFYYCAPWMSLEPTDSEKKRMEEHDVFMNEITSLERWAARLGVLQRRWDGNKEYFEQKRVDVLLSVDMVRHSAAGHIQHAILVAGDSDFIPAVQACQESGATVTLWCGEENTIHKDLKDLADVVHVFDWKKFPGKKSKSQGKTQAKSQGQRKPQAKRQPREKKRKVVTFDTEANKK